MRILLHFFITFATVMKFIAIIPARYASTRFPGKPLAVLGGKTVIQRVYEQVSTRLMWLPTTSVFLLLSKLSVAKLL